MIYYVLGRWICNPNFPTNQKGRSRSGGWIVLGLVCCAREPADATCGGVASTSAGSVSTEAAVARVKSGAYYDIGLSMQHNASGHRLRRPSISICSPGYFVLVACSHVPQPEVIDLGAQTAAVWSSKARKETGASPAVHSSAINLSDLDQPPMFAGTLFYRLWVQARWRWKDKPSRILKDYYVDHK